MNRTQAPLPSAEHQRRGRPSFAFRRTPGCPSFSSSTPAFSRACWTFVSVETWHPIASINDSMRRIVATFTRADFASSNCSIPARARAALSCLPLTRRLKGENIIRLFTVHKTNLAFENSIMVNKKLVFTPLFRKDTPIMKITSSRTVPLRRIFLPCSLALLFAVQVFAQVGGGGSPFDSTLNALLSFAQGTFAKIAAILAVIFGGWQVL
ncbi:MAG: hypothetical protein QOJ99_1506, partial [Bryobacterales bacterium]|nr:hypothetical protein [Bryobacterales bacterium]